MPRRKTIELIEESISPRALILGGGYVAHYLVQQLQEAGCETHLVSDISESTGTYQYIFHFGNAHQITAGMSRLLPHGKYLFIASDEDSFSPDSLPHRTKTLRIGDSNAWTPQELSEKILKSTFSHTSEHIFNVRKKSSSLRDNNQVPKEFSESKIKREVPPPLVQKTRQIDFKKIFLILFSAFCSFVLIAGGILYWYYISIENLYTNFRSHVSRSSWKLVHQDLIDIKRMLIPAKVVYAASYTILVPFRTSSVMQDMGTLLVTVEHILITSIDAFNFFSEITLPGTSPFGNQSQITSLDFQNLTGKVNGLTRALADGKKRIESISTPLFPKDSFTLFLDTTLSRLVSANSLLSLVSTLFVSNETKVYLILLQNNFELRPTGGFIGSFGLLTVGSGKLIDFKVTDVYTADGQLRGHVDPPLPIRKYLSQPNWFLRDSNFDPDFAASSVQAAWFLEKELGTKVDGVIGVNLFVAAEFLRMFGPLTLSDFNNEIVTADNFFLKAQYFTKRDFFPGSTIKKDFLTATVHALQTQILQKKDVSPFDLIASMKKALEEKNILFYSFDLATQKYIEKEGWGGRLVDISCTDVHAPCFADYLAINEANLSVNKANYFVEKSVTIEKRIDESGRLETVVSLAYENKGVPAVVSSDTYGAYIRIVTPRRSILTSITVNAIPLSPSDIDTTSYEPDKTVFGFFIRVAAESKAVVRLTYSLSSSPSSFSSYQLFYQKQGGDKTTPLILSFIQPIPASLRMTPVNFKSISQREEEIYYTTDTSVDRVFALGKK